MTGYPAGSQGASPSYPQYSSPMQYASPVQYASPGQHAPPSYSPGAYAVPAYSPAPVAQVTMVQVEPKDHPVSVFCPRCHNTVTTHVEYRVGAATWLWSLFGCLGCPVGACLYPFCCKCAKNVEHYCPMCRNKLAVYKRL